MIELDDDTVVTIVKLRLSSSSDAYMKVVHPLAMHRELSSFMCGLLQAYVNDEDIQNSVNAYISSDMPDARYNGIVTGSQLLTDEVKQMIADEVHEILKQESIKSNPVVLEDGDIKSEKPAVTGSSDIKSVAHSVVVSSGDEEVLPESVDLQQVSKSHATIVQSDSDSDSPKTVSADDGVKTVLDIDFDAIPDLVTDDNDTNEVEPPKEVKPTASPEGENQIMKMFKSLNRGI